MKRPPRGLTAGEAHLWARLAATVKPLHPRKAPPRGEATAKVAEGVAQRIAPPPAPARRVAPPATGNGIAKPLPPPSGPGPGLDSHWERRLARQSTAPDFTLDLHGHTLDQAHARLDSGLSQARMLGARLVLVITGKPRPVDAADRGERRGAIRAKMLDWLAAGPHASAIAAVRPAHRRHGGEGALYLVLRRPA